MKKFLLSIIGVLGLNYLSLAQAPGSITVYGGPLSTLAIGGGGTVSDVAETIYIGSGVYTIDGIWEIYSRQVVIDPAAVITGTGTIQFINPSVAGGAASNTLLDGNYLSGTNAIDVNIALLNSSGMALTNIDFPPALTALGFTNNSTSSSLYVGRDLNLAADGADITLGTSGIVGDLRLDASATISGYRPARMVITNNSILSHMVKESFTSAFTFPVGIADGDYTPATLTNLSAITVNVGVQDYLSSASPEATTDPGPGGVAADGMNRTWHIFGATAGTGTTLNLQHNTSSNQSGFVDASHFVTQWGTTTPNATGDFTVAFTSSPWQSNASGAGAVGTMITPAGTLAGSTMRSRAYTSLATSSVANQSYFTKSSDPFHPLPINLLSFDAISKGCDVSLTWKVGVETQVKEYRIRHSTDGRTFTVIGSIIPTGASSYNFVHREAAKGLNLYRIEVVEVDGNYSLSSVATISNNCEIKGNGQNVLLYPNPTKGMVTLNGLGVNENSKILVFNMHGRVVHEQSTNNNIETIDFSNLASATYVIQVLHNNERVATISVVKD